MRLNIRVALVAAAALLVACTSASSGGTSESPTADATSAAAVAVAASPIVFPSWTEAEAEAAMGRLLEDRDTVFGVIEYAAVTKDRRLVAPTIELLRLLQFDDELRDTIDISLLAITGESFDGEWGRWVEWLGRNDDVPVLPGFATWKGLLLGRQVDMRFQGFLNSSNPTTIRPELIQWGGVAVDGIPALTNPRFLTAAEATYISPSDLVFGVEVNGDARAYPLRILDWHEMANDVIGGVPVSLTYCTLCGAGVLFETSVDGTVYTFGSSGLLYESNKLMYDRQTGTLWNQLTGKPVSGPLAHSGIELERLPIVVTIWWDWLAEHPDTTVLDIETGHVRDYTPGAAYGEYFASRELMFPVHQRSEALPDKAWVYTLLLDGAPKAYALSTLQDERVVNDVLAGQNIVLVADGRTRAVRAYERREVEFEPGNDGQELADGAAGQWRVTEDALLGPNGESLERLPGHLAYWFGWFSFFPRTQLYGGFGASSE